MTVTDMQEYRPVPVPARIGQATAVEQSRAAAEVMAAVQVALQFPRDETAAMNRMRMACRNRRLADRAFYSFPRAGGRVTGPTVHLAKELARCWGNIQCGIHELSRDDERGQSEMQAFAWDVQTNERVSTTFIVPHLRDTKNGPVRFEESRDIYENNANNGSRRLREMIMSVLPVWFREEAIEICQETINNRGANVMAPERQRALAVEQYAGLGVNQSQLEQFIRKAADMWLPPDLTKLNVLHAEIVAGKVLPDDVFGSAPLTGEELSQKPRTGPDGRAASWGAVQYGAPVENPAEPAPGAAEGWPAVRQPGSER